MTVSPERLLRDLAALWVSLGKEGQAGVLRACTMTLLVLAEESDDPAALGETIAALMPEHPSRAIVVRFGPRRDLEARVFAHCWMPFGQRRQICCEQIEILAPENAGAELAALVLPVTAPDLPAMLWCRAPRLLDLPGLPALAAVAGKVIVDGGAFPDAREALRRVQALLAAGRPAADLAWTRMTRWRELIARIFENRERLAGLPEITDVRIAHGGAAAPAWCWYLGAWVTDALRQAGAAPRLSVAASAAAEPEHLGSLELSGGPGAPRVRMARDGDAAVVEVNSVRARTLLPRPTDYLLLREELGITGRDLVFEKTLGNAASLAVSSTPI